MVDTVRTLAALQALLADNSDQDISAQDVRDFLVSVFPPQFRGAAITKSVNQAVTTGADRTVTFDTVIHDTDSYFDDANDVLTVPTGLGGYYVVTGNISVSSLVGGFFCDIQVDGVDLAMVTRMQSLSNGTAVASWGRVLLLDVGESVGAIVNVEDDAEVSSGQRFTALEISYLGQTPA